MCVQLFSWKGSKTPGIPEGFALPEAHIMARDLVAARHPWVKVDGRARLRLHRSRERHQPTREKDQRCREVRAIAPHQ
jgi:hypothetical protein